MPNDVAMNLGYERRADLRLYSIWKNMKTRCNNPNFFLYKMYGGRGIKVCNEWEHSFDNFYKWSMDNGYSDILTIDRINNDKGYCPDNCRWTSRKEQSRNTSRNVLITYKGKTQCITDWAKETGINKDTIRNRLIAGRKTEDIFDNGDWRRDNGKNFTKLL